MFILSRSSLTGARVEQVQKEGIHNLLPHEQHLRISGYDRAFAAENA
jgi:hypothetical protein